MLQRNLVIAMLFVSGLEGCAAARITVSGSTCGD